MSTKTTSTTSTTSLITLSDDTASSLVYASDGTVSPNSFHFKSESLRNFAASVATLAIDANASAHGYRKQLCRLFASNRIGDTDYTQDGFKGFKDFASKVFNLKEATAYQYMGAGTIYNNPAFSGNPIIESLPVATVYVLAGLSQDELNSALEYGQITEDTTQQEAKDYVAMVKVNRGKTPATSDSSDPSDSTASSDPSDSTASSESPSTGSPDPSDSSEPAQVLKEYDFALEISGGFVKNFVGTWPDLEDAIMKEAGVVSDFDWTKPIPVKDAEGKLSYRIQMFTTLDNTQFGRVRYRNAPKAKSKSKSNQATTTISMADYQALQAKLKELEAQLRKTE